MGWLATETPHVQNDTFQRKGYLPICKLACAGAIADPEQPHHITFQRTFKEGHGRDAESVRREVTECLSEGIIFATVRNAVLGLPGRVTKEDAESFLGAVPVHILDAATSCAETIRDNNCLSFVVANGAIRTNRAQPTLEAVTPVVVNAPQL
jgi:hypothetical protein